MGASSARGRSPGRVRRVVRPHIHGPWIPRVIAAAFGWSLVLCLLFWTPIALPIWKAVFGLLRGWNSVLVSVVVGILVTSLPYFVIAYKLRSCSHRAWNFGIGAVFGAFSSVGPAIQMLGHAEAAHQGLVLLVIPWAASVGGGLLFTICVVRDGIWGRSIVQDGTLCPFCAYRVDNLPSNRCPECGKTFTAEELRGTPSDSDTAPSPWSSWRRSDPPYLS
jgi:hypothetical protein